MHIDGKDRDKFFSETINASIRFFGSLGLALIVLIPLIFSTLIDVKYTEAYQYIPILITGAFFSAIANLHGVIYIAKKQTKQIAKTAVMSAILNITLTLLLVNFIGIYAAAISTAVAYLAMAIYRYQDVKKYVTISYERNILLKMAALHVFAISLYYVNHIVGNLINLIVIITITVLLNKSMIKVVKDKILSLRRHKQKTPTIEQEAYEDSL
jgi:O-antigen/teichoic acid export membrane protein